MLQERQKQIYDILCETGKIYVKELAKTLFVSEMTVRRDLSEMEKAGVLKRFRGGAVFCTEENEVPISQRIFIETEEKKKLCRYAEKYIANNLNIFIDSSSTCLFLVPLLRKYTGIKIYTNSINVLQIASRLHIPCFLTGGEYYENDMCFVGSFAEEAARGLNPDVSFFSSLGFSEDGVISDKETGETAVRRILMKNSKKTVFLFEKNKLGKKYVYTLCRKEDCTDVITAESCQ